MQRKNREEGTRGTKFQTDLSSSVVRRVTVLVLLPVHVALVVEVMFG